MHALLCMLCHRTRKLLHCFKKVNRITHGVYVCSITCCSQDEHFHGLCVSHISRKLAAGFLLFIVLACSLQRRFIGDLTCAVTPAEPHMFQLGKLHSALNSNEATSRAETIDTIDTLDYVAVATELMLFFLKKLKSSAKVFSSYPHSSSPLIS